MTKFMVSSTPNSSASVELLEFTFYLHGIDNTASFPNVSIAPLWLRIVSCTANDISTLHNKVPDLSNPSTNSMLII